MVEKIERGHTVTFTCEFRDSNGQLDDPTDTGSATAKIYRRDELIENLSTEQVSEGVWRAKYTIPATATLEEYYVQWGWSDGDAQCGRYKFRVIHTGIDQ